MSRAYAPVSPPTTPSVAERPGPSLPRREHRQVAADIVHPGHERPLRGVAHDRDRTRVDLDALEQVQVHTERVGQDRLDHVAVGDGHVGGASRPVGGSIAGCAAIARACIVGQRLPAGERDAAGVVLHHLPQRVLGQDLQRLARSSRRSGTRPGRPRCGSADPVRRRLTTASAVCRQRSSGLVRIAPNRTSSQPVAPPPRPVPGPSSSSSTPGVQPARTPSALAVVRPWRNNRTVVTSIKGMLPRQECARDHLRVPVPRRRAVPVDAAVSSARPRRGDAPRRSSPRRSRRGHRRGRPGPQRRSCGSRSRTRPHGELALWSRTCSTCRSCRWRTPPTPASGRSWRSSDDSGVRRPEGAALRGRDVRRSRPGRSRCSSGPGYAVTIRHGTPRRAAPESASAGDLRADRMRPDAACSTRSLDVIVDGYLDIVEHLDQDIEARRGDRVQRLPRRPGRADLQPEAGEPGGQAGRDAIAGECPDRWLGATGTSRCRPALAPYFRDIGDHVLRANDLVETYDQLLDDDAHGCDVAAGPAPEPGHAQDLGLGAIIAVPTAIAGVYGMNFDDMPELHWRSATRGAGRHGGRLPVLYRLFKKSAGCDPVALGTIGCMTLSRIGSGGGPRPDGVARWPARRPPSAFPSCPRGGPVRRVGESGAGTRAHARRVSQRCVSVVDQQRVLGGGPRPRQAGEPGPLRPSTAAPGTPTRSRSARSATSRESTTRRSGIGASWTGRPSPVCRSRRWRASIWRTKTISAVSVDRIAGRPAADLRQRERLPRQRQSDRRRRGGDVQIRRH